MKSAPAGNRTRVTSMATRYSTTRPRYTRYVCMRALCVTCSGGDAGSAGEITSEPRLQDFRSPKSKKSSKFYEIYSQARGQVKRDAAGKSRNRHFVAISCHLRSPSEPRRRSDFTEVQASSRRVVRNARSRGELQRSDWTHSWLSPLAWLVGGNKQRRLPHIHHRPDSSRRSILELVRSAKNVTRIRCTLSQVKTA